MKTWERTVRERVDSVKDSRPRAYRILWSQYADSVLATLSARREALRTRVREFLTEAATELIAIDAVQTAFTAGCPTPGPREEPEPKAEDVEEGDTVTAGAEDTEAVDDGDGGDEPAPEPAPGSQDAEDRRAKVLELHAAGKSGRSIAKELNLHQTQVQRVLKSVAEPVAT